MNYFTCFEDASSIRTVLHHMYRWIGLCVYLLLVVGCKPQVVQASGFYLPARGVHSLGRAGASIAGGDTLQTMWFNPANLSEFQGFHTLFDVGVIATQATFQRAARVGPDGQNQIYDPVHNEAPPIPDPSIMLSYGWKNPKVTVAYGLYAPYATNLKFPEQGAQRYAMVDLTGSIFLINHLSAAWEPHPRFRIGAGFQGYTAIVRLMTAASAYIGVFGAPEDPNLDLYTEASIQVPFAPSGNAGMWGRILDFKTIKLDAAVSVQLPVSLPAQGSIRVRLPTHPLFDPTRVEGERIQTDLSFPWIIRGAVRAHLFDRANIEVAFVYEMWSVFEKVRLTPKDGIVVKDVPTIGDFKIPSLEIERHFVDTFSVRVGGSVRVTDAIELRAGYTFEKGAIPDKTFSVFLLDSDKHLLAVGATFNWKNHSFDVAYGIHLFQKRRITNSDVRQINPLNPTGAIVIGNGTYETMVHVIGLGWRGRF